jgi:bleomycin hydrolase
MKKLNFMVFVLSFLGIISNGNTQDTIRNKKGSDYLFTKVVNYEALPVESQGMSGTCWSFSALSFFESELIRMGKDEVRLSEMYVVHKAYEDKADMYVRMHGNSNFGAGGAFHDIPHVIAKYGIVPEEIYTGLNYGSEKHKHGEMDEILKAVVDAVVKNKNKSLTPVWRKSIEGTLDGYLGEIPEEFEYKGKTYTPISFAKHLGLNMDDYVEISSYNHHPFYSQFVLEVPDNWTYGSVYNLPLDDMMRVIDNALMDGYTIAWGADVSEKGFSFRNSLALVPEDESTIKSRGSDSKNYNDAGSQKTSSAFDEPVEEKTITQEMRQEAFDNYETTDDHGMHITGIYKDQNGNKYYFIKNSWGTKYNDLDGYFLASEAYVRYKTMDFMVHKDALPKDIRKKLGIK